MSYSDDVLLTVAKELFLSRAEPRHNTVYSRNDEEYVKRLERIADDFFIFYKSLRHKLTHELEL